MTEPAPTPDPAAVARAIEAYGAAWIERDPTRRRALLDVAWAEDAVYSDPLAEVVGRDALSDHIGATQESLAGGEIRITTAPVTHHANAFFRWTTFGADDSELLSGWDVVQLDADGRIARLTGFFDPDTERR